jgi:response regulator RpfG family c-di-GMP phosphodiesterase
MSAHRRSPRLAAVLVAVIAAGAALVAYASHTLGGVESATIDARFSVRGAQRPKHLVVVAIDDKTFSDLNQNWPFPRSLHARAIDRLTAAGAREIVYDVQFTEPTKPREDLALYDAVARSRRVILATTETDQHGHTNVLGGDENLARAHAVAAAANLPAERGGMIRRFGYKGVGIKTLAVAAAERANGRVLSPSSFGRSGAWIDYRGPPGTVPTVSFSDLLAGRVNPQLLRRAVVVIGVSDPTLQDVHPTPVTHHELMSGAEVQANAIWTAVHGLPLRSAPAWLELLAIVLLGGAAPLVLLRLGVLRGALVCVVAAAAFAGACQLAFDGGTIVALTYPLGSLLLGAVGGVGLSYAGERNAREATSRYNAELEQAVRERTRELRETQLEIVQRLGQAAEWRDHETAMHIDRMSRLSHRLAVAAGMSEEDADMLLYASAMHDVGKIGIPDRVLLKPGPLDPDEWEIMKTHTTIGASILSGSSSPLLRMAEEIALTHHERWDGGGYPRGLSGEEIPLVGRICAVCDVFDALTSKRPYKDAWLPAQALDEIWAQRGRHFDPRLVELFMQFTDLVGDTPAAADEVRVAHLVGRE